MNGRLQAILFIVMVTILVVPQAVLAYYDTGQLQVNDYPAQLDYQEVASVGFSAYSTVDQELTYVVDQLDADCDQVVANLATQNFTGEQSREFEAEFDGSDLDSNAVEADQTCIRLCVAFDHPSGGFAKCDLEQLPVGQPGMQYPEFTDVPTTNVEITDDWQFQLQADDDTEQLTYLLVQAPEFLSMAEGLLTANFQRADTGRYEVIVQVWDPQQNYDEYQFAITISDDQQFVSDTTAEMVIVTPESGSILAQDEVILDWVASDASGIEAIRIEYKQWPQGDWQQIYSFNGQGQEIVERTSPWDTSGLGDGEYYLRGVIINSQQQVSELALGRWQIGEGRLADSGIAIFINVQPQPDTIINTATPTITGGVIPAVGEQIVLDSFVFQFDGEEVQDDWCVFTHVKFECAPLEPLDTGLHAVSVSAEDTSGKRGIKKWEFTIDGSAAVLPPSADPANPAGNVATGSTLPGFQLNTGLLLLIIVLGCVALILIGGSWFLYRLWSGRDEYGYTTTTTTTTEYGSMPQPAADYFEPVGSYDYSVTGSNDDPLQPVATNVAPPPPAAVPVDPQPAATNSPAEAKEKKRPSWLEEVNSDPVEPVPAANIQSFNYAKQED